ncbi:hypothetical protein [Poseidonibacter sp.]|uniref:hypothetical protein n=1 Tax=Poseidonibacter sp. TaxID=2321188 RepID=UPI003C7103AF
MKQIKITLIAIFLILNFTACSSKVQTDVIDSNKKDISELLSNLIKKEKQINKLMQELEDCKKAQKEGKDISQKNLDKIN